MPSPSLETIVEEIKRHSIECPEHGVACVCMDKHVHTLRLATQSIVKDKDIKNLYHVFALFMR